jgi:hypothetical protein
VIPPRLPARSNMNKLLFLAHGGDTTATWAAAALTRRLGPGRVVCATPEDLALAPCWSHGLEGDRVRTRLVLRDGSEFSGEEPLLVFDRIRTLSLPQFVGAHSDDQNYASMELFALLLSWLASLHCPVINPVSPRGLSGPGWHALTWQKLAQGAGLPVREQLLTSSSRRASDPALAALDGCWAAPEEAQLFRNLGDRPAWSATPAGERWARVLVVGGRALGDAPPELRTACVRLASRARLALLEIWFGVVRGAPGRWFFAGANPFPDITRREELDALVEFLAEAGVPAPRAARASAAGAGS